MSSRPKPPASTRPTRERDHGEAPSPPKKPFDIPDDPERDPQDWIDEDTGTERVDRDPENPPAPTSEDISDRNPPDRTLR